MFRKFVFEMKITPYNFYIIYNLSNRTKIKTKTKGQMENIDSFGVTETQSV